ncbi:hypothetical protein BDF14DRAFT_212310 [Spinellus fusiger]|nr:hypothetical protein BDF14DRAFT_212310 [Spinellus fusiger]
MHNLNRAYIDTVKQEESDVLYSDPAEMSPIFYSEGQSFGEDPYARTRKASYHSRTSGYQRSSSSSRETYTPTTPTREGRRTAEHERGTDNWSSSMIENHSGINYSKEIMKPNHYEDPLDYSNPFSRMSCLTPSYRTGGEHVPLTMRELGGVNTHKDRITAYNYAYYNCINARTHISTWIILYHRNKIKTGALNSSSVATAAKI